MANHTCPNCNKSFQTDRKSSKYCGRVCQFEGRKVSLVKRACLNSECSLAFEASPNSKKKFCSHACAALVSNATRAPSTYKNRTGACVMCAAVILKSEKHCTDCKPETRRQLIARGVNRCSTCGETKSVVEFKPNQSRAGGFDNYCTACYSEYWKDWYSRRGGKEGNAVRNKKYYYSELGQRNAFKKRLNRYGLTESQFLALQDTHPVCPICMEREATAIDHDHETGEVRGLLCNSCNLALGMFMDSTDALLRAVSYLKKSN